MPHGRGDGLMGNTPIPGEVWVQALAGDTALHSWVRQLSQCLSPPRSANGYRRIFGELNKLQGSDPRWTSMPSRGRRNTLSHFMLKKPGWAPAAMSQSWLQGFTVFHVMIPAEILESHFSAAFSKKIGFNCQCHLSNLYSRLCFFCKNRLLLFKS